MEKFELTKTADGQQLRVPKRGSDLLRFPLFNKGTAFSAEERARFGLDGLLPAQIGKIDTQQERVYRSIMFNEDPVGRHIDLAGLQDRNEHLYYKVLSSHLEDLKQHRRGRLAFEPIINEFNGRRTVEMQMLDLQFPS